MLENIEQQLPDSVKEALPYLMIGGGGALLGGLASDGRRKRDGETRTGYALRIAKNMALAGALAGGGAYGLKKGFDGLNESVDYDNPRTGENPELSPVSSTLRSVAFSPLTAGATGLGTLALTTGGKNGLSSSIHAADRDARKIFFPDDSAHAKYGDIGQEAIAAKLKDAPSEGSANALKRMLNLGGHSTHEAEAKLGKDLLSRLGTPSSVAKPLNFAMHHSENAYRKTLGQILGQEGKVIGRRGALGLAAALTPALLGALFTDPIKQSQP